LPFSVKIKKSNNSIQEIRRHHNKQLNYQVYFSYSIFLSFFFCILLYLASSTSFVKNKKTINALNRYWFLPW